MSRWEILANCVNLPPDHTNQVIGMERVRLKRRLTAVLLADVVGYSRLMSVDEEGTHAKLAGYVKDLIEPKIVEHGGRLIRSMGDGFLVEFDSAVDAVRCAIEIQARLTDHNSQVEAHRRIQLRIGINTGDVIVNDHDIYGNSVNIAARLEGLAQPGQIYVTRGVRDQLEGYPDLSVEDRGERKLKNIERPIRVYRVQHVQRQETRVSLRALVTVRRLFSGATIRFSSRATVLSTAVLAMAITVGIAGPPMWRDYSQSPRASIMVLPFRNASGDAGEDYFADAVTDDLTTDLSRLSDTFVIARASAFRYKGKLVDARQIGREFSVRYLLEGAIRKVGMRVQTNAELIDTRSAVNIWAERFENELTDLGELKEAVTGRIAASLHIQLIRAENRRAMAERPTDPDAIDWRLRAMAHLIQDFTAENTLAARQALEKSMALAPSAEATGQLAFLLVSDYLNHYNKATKENEFKRAEAVLQQALKFDQPVAIAYVAEGFIRRVNGNHQAALESFDRALQLDANLALACAQKANQLVFLGRAEEAPPFVTKALQISPIDPSTGVFYWILGRAYFAMQDYKSAIDWLRKSVDSRPTLWFNRAYLIAAYALERRLDEREVQTAIGEFKSRFGEYDMNRIRQYYIADVPYSHKKFQTSLDELYKGLTQAGVQ
jgi:adenylate cyclase